MKTKYVFVLCILSLLTGCYRSGRFYPIQGPLASQSPPPVFAARASGAFNSGSLKVTLANGEVCQGPWSMVKDTPTAGSGASKNTGSQVDLSSTWDTVYGAGFYTANILGSRLHVQGTLSGNKGTVLNVELYRRDTTDNLEIRGVARDGSGNIYKVVF